MKKISMLLRKLNAFSVLTVTVGIFIFLLAVPVLFNLTLDQTESMNFWLGMHLNSSVSISCLGFAMIFIALNQHKIASALGFTSFTLGLLTLLQYLGGFNLGIDELFRAATSATIHHPGRMAPVTTIAFVASGLATVLLARKKPSGNLLTTAGILGSIAAGLGLIKIISYAFGLAGSPDSQSFLYMAAGTGLAVSFTGMSLIAFCVRELRQNTEESYRIFPFCVSLGLVIFTLSLWQALLNVEASHIQQLIVLNTDDMATETKERVDQIGFALKRYATRVEYLGYRDKKFLELDAQSYIEHMPAIRRIGLIDKKMRVFWSFPENIRRQVEGFDESSNETRKSALDQTLLTREPSMSGSTALLSGGLGFILPVAIFRSHEFDGFLYATIETDKIFKGLEKSTDFQVSILEDGNEIFTEKKSDVHHPELTHTKSLILGQANLEIVAAPTDQFLDKNTSRIPFIVLLGGGLLSILCGGYLQTLALNRRNDRRHANSEQILMDRLNIALKSTGIGLWSMDIETGEFWRSQNHDEIFGHARSLPRWNREIFFSHVIPEDRVRVREEQRNENAKNENIKTEFRIRRAQGDSIRWIRSQSKIVKDELNRPLLVIGVIEDITKQRLEEEQLNVTHERLTRVIDATGEGIWERDMRNNNVHFVDVQCKKIYGFDSDEAVSFEMLRKAMHPDDMQTVNSALTLLVSQKRERFEFEFRIMGRTEGVSVRWVRSKGKILYSANGEAERLVSTVSDITAEVENRLRLKEALSKAETATLAKSNFLATMSHEIRTPLNAIIGMTDLLIENQLDVHQRKYAEIIQQSGTNLLALISDILDFSKIEAGKIELEKTDFSLSQLVESQADVLAARAKSQGISLMTYFASDLPNDLVGDAGRIGQVLVNLIGNAVKFTKLGGVKVKVAKNSSHSGTDEKVWIRFEIEDTGIGLSEAGQQKLFKPFVQVDDGAKRHYGGTGLGLSISKRLVEVMGGEIGVISTERKGSIFWFELPFELSTTKNVSKKLLIPTELDGIHVLVVDDDNIALEVMGQYFESWQMRPVRSSHFDDALNVVRAASLKKDPVDLVVIGQGQNAKDGAKLGRELRHDLGMNCPPLIFMAEIGQQEKDLASIFKEILYKPIKQSELLDALMTSLSKVAGPTRARALEPIQNNENENFEGLKILVADDIAANQMLALKLLESIGYSANAVADGREAFQAVRNFDYDLVLMDCQMPEVDGFEATKMIREFELTTKRHIPIIALTANAMSGDSQKCIAAGMDDYLSKPIKKDKLRAILNKWLKDPRIQKVAS